MNLAVYVCHIFRAKTQIFSDKHGKAAEMEDDAADMASDNSIPLGVGASAYGSENGEEELDFMPQRTLPFLIGYSEPVG